jgi:predicted dehydrogenase
VNLPGDFASKGTADMIRVVQVGFGAIGQRRVRVLREMVEVELVGVVDPGTEAQERARAQLGPEVRVGADCGALLAQVTADAVIVSTPHHLHAETLRQALAHGAHVLCEKPLGVSQLQAQDCLGLARAHGRLLKAATNHLYFPSVQRALEALRESSLGAIQRIRVAVGHGRYESLPAWLRDRECAGGGTLRDNGAHGLLLLHQVLRESGDAIAEVSCELEYPMSAPGGDVRARCDMVSEQGVAVRLESRWVGPLPYQFDVDILAQRGSVHISGPERCVIRAEGTEQSHQLGGHPDDSWRRDTRAFIEAIAAGAHEHPSAEVASDCGRVLDALYASAEAQRPVRLRS